MTGRRTFLSTTFALCTGLALFGTATSARADEVTYAAKPYESHGVQLNVSKIFHKGDKVWFRLRVVNSTGKVLTIDKNQIQCRLPDDTVVTRAMGVFGKYAKPSNIGPGLSSELNVECEVGAVPVPVALVLKQGFIVDGKSLPLADYRANAAGVK